MWLCCCCFGLSLIPFFFSSEDDENCAFDYHYDSLGYYLDVEDSVDELDYYIMGGL